MTLAPNHPDGAEPAVIATGLMREQVSHDSRHLNTTDPSR